ncbi:MAG: type II secretion system F family protein [Rhizobiaceae bacterium]
MVAQLTHPESILALLTAVGVFASIMVVLMPMMARDNLGNRMKSVALEREKLRARERAKLSVSSREGRRKQGAKKREPDALIKFIVEKLNLRRALADERTEIELIQAGFRGQSPLFIFLGLRFGLPILFGALAAIYFYFIKTRVPGDEMSIKLYCLGAAFAGFYLPLLVVRQILKKRQLSITQAWPDALDLCLICVESGMSIEASFRKVAAEIGPQSVALAEELMITTAELSFLQERRTAYENLTNRTGLESVKNVVLSLIQSEKYGTPLSTALRVLSQENRDIRMNLAEKKAASLPPKLTVPMMVCFLPALFCVILGPAAIRTLATFAAQ